MKRNLADQLQIDLNKKIALITGPRQVGKTTLSKAMSENYEYLNYDLLPHREIMREMSWDRSKELVIFDELHKMNRWKSWIKGIYDVEGIPPKMIVTGSAKLSAFQKTGDSLAGRHFLYRLHPFDLKEVLDGTNLGLDESFQRLMNVGGFPEPFLEGHKPFYNKWKRAHIDLILKEDLLDLTLVRDIKSIQVLIELLRKRVGSPLSINSLARDLQRSSKTVTHWIELLENLYIIFRVSPYHRNVSRSLLKESKFYFYDNAMVQGEDDGPKLENLVACSLLKEVHFQQDVLGENFKLHYLRTKDGVEVDFLISKDEIPKRLYEVKLSDQSLAKSLGKFFKDKEDLQRLQLVLNLDREKTFPQGEEIRSVKNHLANLNLEN